MLWPMQISGLDSHPLYVCGHNTSLGKALIAPHWSPDRSPPLHRCQCNSGILICKTALTFYYCRLLNCNHNSPRIHFIQLTLHVSQWSPSIRKSITTFTAIAPTLAIAGHSKQDKPPYKGRIHTLYSERGQTHYKGRLQRLGPASVSIIWGFLSLVMLARTLDPGKLAWRT